jgi:hypothetical protein
MDKSSSKGCHRKKEKDREKKKRREKENEIEKGEKRGNSLIIDVLPFVGIIVRAASSSPASNLPRTSLHQRGVTERKRKIKR